MAAATASAARRFFERRYRETGTRARAAGTKAYLKSDLRFYGTTMTALRRLPVWAQDDNFGKMRRRRAKPRPRGGAV